MRRTMPTNEMISMEDALATLEYLGACEEGLDTVRSYTSPQAALLGNGRKHAAWLVDVLGGLGHVDTQHLLPYLPDAALRALTHYPQFVPEESRRAYESFKEAATTDQRDEAVRCARKAWTQSPRSTEEATARAVYVMVARAGRTQVDRPTDGAGALAWRAYQLKHRLECLDANTPFDAHSKDQATATFANDMLPLIFAGLAAANAARIAGSKEHIK
jgi:hypothetical protein